MIPYAPAPAPAPTQSAPTRNVNRDYIEGRFRDIENDIQELKMLSMNILRLSTIMLWLAVIFFIGTNILNGIELAETFKGV